MSHAPSAPPESAQDREFRSRLEVLVGDQRVAVALAGLAIFLFWRRNPWGLGLISAYLGVALLCALGNRRRPGLITGPIVGPSMIVFDVTVVCALAQVWGPLSRPVLWMLLPIVCGWTLSGGRRMGQLALLAGLLGLVAAVMVAPQLGLAPPGDDVRDQAFALTTMALALATTHSMVDRIVQRWQEHARTASQLLAERKLREREQELATQLEASQRLESLGRLAGGVAHDFNNLLTGLVGQAGLAESHLESDPTRARRALEELQRSAERGAHITAQLLDYARQRPREPLAVDVGALLDEWRPLFEQLLGSRGRLSVHSPGEGRCWIRIDPGELERALFNLASNARDAFESQGHLQLCVRREGERVLLDVRDDGVGIAPAHLPRIFEPFYTGKPLGEGGTGLGLSSVFGVVRRSDGRIDVRSELGRGTTFRLDWPATEAPTPEPASAPKRRASVRERDASAERRPVLVVDDDEAIRLVARAQLEAAGFEVELAEGPRAALALLSSRPTAHFGMLITDVVMPGSSGVELAEAFGSHAPGAPVLLMSGYPDDVLSERHGTHWSMLEKPFTAQQMVDAVHRALRTP